LFRNTKLFRNYYSRRGKRGGGSFISYTYAVSIPWIVRLACRTSSSTAVSSTMKH
jgi:hypothetical protein